MPDSALTDTHDAQERTDGARPGSWARRKRPADLRFVPPPVQGGGGRGAIQDPSVRAQGSLCYPPYVHCTCNAEGVMTQDGRDHQIHICKICLQKVLQKRMLATKNSAPCCNLCSEPTAQLPKGKVKQCAHEMCKKLYCAPCIDRIMGKAQVHLLALSATGLAFNLLHA